MNNCRQDIMNYAHSQPYFGLRDLYDYLAGEPSAINAFRGEYMTNYSEWSNNAFDAFYK